MGDIVIKYGFEFENKDTFVYEVTIDGKDYSLKPKDMQVPPEWAKLEFEKCENCPLNSASSPFCPVAKNLDGLIQATQDKISHEKTRVIVKTPERTISKMTSAQDGLFSLFGLIMPTCGCPHLDFLRPLVKFHLPFATIEETLFRVLGSQLVKNYLEKGNKSGEVVMEELLKKYEAVELVNQGLMNRINKVVKGDADKNAIVSLNIFAQMFNCEFSNNFEILAELFPELKRNA